MHPRVGHRRDRPLVAIYRRSLLAASETFVRGEPLALRRYSSLFVGDHRQQGLDLPRGRVLVGRPGGPRMRDLRRRLPAHDPQRRLLRGCRRRGVDLVHAHFGPDGVEALGLARALGVPLIVTFHGYDATMTDEALLAEGGVLASFVRRRAELFEESSLILAVSQFIADELRRQGAPESKLRVHHLGVPREEVPARTAGEPVVLFVGRQVEKKGLADLIEAMAEVRARVPGARLVVAGDGPLHERHEAQARDLGLDVEFAGWVTPPQVVEQLKRVRVLCVPSRRAASGDAEGLPTVIPEALALGLPVVGTRHSGIPEALGDGELGGLLADEGDVAGIARQLTAVLDDDDLWRRLSRSARRNAEENFDLTRQAQELERLYDLSLNGARA
jgi:glycosyltransferase involved in cell wall biosynthesis